MAAHCPQETTIRKQTTQALEMALGLFRLRIPESSYLGQALSGFLISCESQRKARVGPLELKNQDQGPTCLDLRMKSTMSLIQHSAE